MHQVSIQHSDFNFAEEYQRMATSSQAGAVVGFVGLVRDINLDQSISGLYLEHYPGMTEKSLQAICEQAASRWPILASKIIHRIGQLDVNQQIVMVLVSSAHRQAAFEACQFMMDYLKTQAPFWKKERRANGEDVWLDARESDQEALQRWSKNNG